jgi:hypothetical protein
MLLFMLYSFFIALLALSFWALMEYLFLSLYLEYVVLITKLQP